MMFNYLALFSLALSTEAAWGFTTSSSPAATAFQATASPKPAFLSKSANSVLLFSDVAGSSEEAVAAVEESEEAVAAVEESEEAVAAVEEVAVPDAAAPKAAAAPKKKANQDRHTLFVGNLPFEVTDSQLRDVFSEHGTVELVSIPKNKDTGSSRGFAFVDMSSAEEMKTAADALHQTDYGGRSLRVQPSLPKDEAEKQAKKTDEGTQKIYVGNLPFDATQDQVMSYYSEFGDVKEVYMPMDTTTGAPRGFAFVTLDEAVAEKAIEETNEVNFMGRQLSVSMPLPRGDKGARKRDPRQKLYIGNLSFETEADTLRELFEEFGNVYDCYMPEDPDTGGSRGFGFVTLDKEDAQAAIDATDGCELEGRSIRVNEAKPKGAPRNFDDDNGEANEY